MQIPTYFANRAALLLSSDICPSSSSPSLPPSSSFPSLSPVKFLDVAAGTGALTLALMKALDDSRLRHSEFTVTDFAQGMVEASRALIESTDFAAGRVDFQVKDAQDLRYGDGSFTHIGCMFGIMFFADRSKGLREMHRVLQEEAGLAVIGRQAFLSSHHITPSTTTAQYSTASRYKCFSVLS